MGTRIKTARHKLVLDYGGDVASLVAQDEGGGWWRYHRTEPTERAHLLEAIWSRLCERRSIDIDAWEPMEHEP